MLCIISLLLFIIKKWALHRFRLWFLILGNLSLGLFFVQIDPFLNLWDEQFHVLVGKHLIESPLHPRLLPSDLLPYNYQNWVENYTWLHKQPLALWQIALSMWLFGTNIIAARLPMVILHALLVYPVFRIGTIAYDKKVGYISAFLFTLLLYPLELVSGLHTAEHIDLSFMFYITGSIWCWFEWQHSKNKRWLVFLGIFAGLAVLTKWLVGLLVYAGFSFHLFRFNSGLFRWKTWSPLAFSLAITILIFVPWQVYTAIAFANEFNHEMTYNSLHFFETIEKQGGGWLFYWHNLFTIYGLRPFWKWVLLLIVLSLFFKKDKTYPIFIGIVITTTYAFFSLASTKMPSFCIIVAPLVLIAAVGQISTLFTTWTLKKQHYKWYKVTSFILLFGIGLTLFRPAQLLRNHYLDESQYWVRQKLEQTHTFIQNYNFPKNEDVIIFTNDYFHKAHVLWIFHHDIHAYSTRPEDNVLMELANAGYTLYEAYELETDQNISIVNITPNLDH